MKNQIWCLLINFMIFVSGASSVQGQNNVDDWTDQDRQLSQRSGASAVLPKGDDENLVDDEVTNLALTDVLDWMVAATIYDPPKRLPQIDFKSAAFFAEQVCSSHSKCIAKGGYRDGSHTIILHESYKDLSEIRARAMLVHEVVHFLQDLSGRWSGVSCSAMIEREREAYLLQFRYLVVKGGIPPQALRLPSISETNCVNPQRSASRQVTEPYPPARPATSN
jgi:hypothetical protein